MREIIDRISQPQCRLVSLVGPGGTGKSRLSLRVADELLSRFSDGVFVVSLVSITDPALVMSHVASTLQISESSDGALAALTAHLEDKQLLLVLDNFEQVQAAAGDVAALLMQCPSLRVLATSREALAVTGGLTFEVPGLALPDESRWHDIESLRKAEAVRLFVERAQAAQPDFSPDDAAYLTIARICQQVDVLPLAIELAAARVPTLPVERILRALERKRMKVLSGGGADLLGHQQNLRDLVAWSYDLLAPDEQLLWLRLAIFVGGSKR